MHTLRGDRRLWSRKGRPPISTSALLSDALPHHASDMAARGVSRGPVARPQPPRPTPATISEYDAPLTVPKKAVLGISSRLIDVVLVVWLVFFAVAAGFTGA